MTSITGLHLPSQSFTGTRGGTWIFLPSATQRKVLKVYLGMEVLMQKSRGCSWHGLFFGVRLHLTPRGPPLPSGMGEMRSGQGFWQLIQVPKRVCSDRPRVDLAGSQVSPPPCGCHSTELSPTILPHQTSSGQCCHWSQLSLLRVLPCGACLTM